MKRDLLDQFWHDYYQVPEKNKANVAIENWLKDFRKTLDPSSLTAKTIDHGN